MLNIEAGSKMGQRQHIATTASATLSEFVYELLDAHDDTMQLATDQIGDLSWEAHLDYLRRLQRVGRELLAHHVED
jgi:hypothetical protein